MSTQTHAADHSAVDAIGEAVSPDADLQSRRELEIATWLLVGVAMLVVFIAVLVWLFGLPVLGIVGLIATVLVFAILTAYAAGF
ncbi:hypothetical protein KTN05_01940 [Paracoccus sp. Z118]|uniref:hypothetical protein n=1 Tax=Paracoccus sp. Z118 TaxID=2851017 RepID=UPI001C2C2049|nr:hypothetical protein [Paracoccus sp. Z118]MBV0890609.1 hypothetical protein [Paracoccus sp. Z118]